MSTETGTQVSAALPAGTILQADDGGIKIIGFIAQGGFGITYLAYDNDSSMQCDVCLKEFYPKHFCHRNTNLEVVPIPGQEGSFQHSLSGFSTEVEALSKLLKHPNIVKVYYTFEELGTCFYGMEYLKGETLSSYIKQYGKLKPKEAVELLLPVLNALDYVHRRGLLHRDISPRNIMLVKEPGKSLKKVRPVLIDFGASHDAEHLSRSIQMVQTPCYASYEQAMGSVACQGPWSDVYSIAAVLYYLITGREPPHSENRTNEDSLEKPSEIITISNSAEKAILDAMAVGYTGRTQDIWTLVEQLCDAFSIQVPERFDYHDTSNPQPPPPSPQPLPPQPPPLPPNPAHGSSSLAVEKRFTAAMCDQLLPDIAVALTAVLISLPVAAIVFGVIFLAYGTLNVAGGTLGMRIMKLQIASNNKNKPSLLSMFLLGGLCALPIVPVIYAIITANLGRHLTLTSLEGYQTGKTHAILFSSDDSQYPIQDGSYVHRAEPGMNYSSVLDGGIYLLDGTISSTHCVFRFFNNEWTIMDCGSRNGTFLTIPSKNIRNERLKANVAVPIESGATIIIGTHNYQFIIEEE